MSFDSGADVTYADNAAPTGGTPNGTAITRTGPVSPDDDGSAFIANEVASYHCNRPGVTDSGSPFYPDKIFQQLNAKGSGGGGAYGAQPGSFIPADPTPSTYKEMFVGLWYRIPLDSSEITGSGFSNTPVNFPQAGTFKVGYIRMQDGALHWLEMNYDGSHTLAPFGDGGPAVISQDSGTVARYPGSPGVLSEFKPSASWYQVEYYLKAATTPGGTDGVVKVWINTVLNIQATNVTTGSIYVENWHGNGQYGGGGSADRPGGSDASLISCNAIRKIQHQAIYLR